MIIRDIKDGFIMISQNDHAHFSGDVAKNFTKEFFTNDLYYKNALFAVHEHDRSWIRLDETPIWNDKKLIPFSFVDYPLLPKIILYERGIDEVEEIDKYAALICSMHYSSFNIFQTSEEIDCKRFYSSELERQSHIKNELNINHLGEQINKHFRLLQVCDDISLYVCLNQPGVSKESEHPWYKNGFKNSELFDIEGRHQKLIARWLNEREINISPSPFENDFTTKLRFKFVKKELVQQLGIAEAYMQIDAEEQEVSFVNRKC